MKQERRKGGKRLVTIVALLFSALAAQAQVSPRPQRIISLVPAVTEMLFAIGAGERVVAVSSFDRFPPEVVRLPRVGALLDPDTERILALRPDLVAIYHTQHDLQARLNRAQIPVFSYEHAGLADVTRTLRQLGERVGAAARAAQLTADIERRIDIVRKRTRGARRPRTLVLLGRDTFALRGMFASGGVGFVHDMLTAAGGDNVFADVKRESVPATTELVIARRPEVIIELRAEPLDAAERDKEVGAWGALTSIPAVRNRRIQIIGDPRTIIPGPRVADGVELLERVLHGAR